MSADEKRGSGGHQRLDRAVRLVFERKGSEVKLVSAERLRMVVPPPQALYPAHGGEGSWLELRDRDDRPTYRRVIDDPLQEIEVVADNPKRPLQRLAGGEPRGAFFLIVPDIAGARRVALRSAARAAGGEQAAGKGGRKRAAQPLLEFDFSRVDRKER